MKRESWSYKIRTYLATQDGPRYVGEITEGIGHPGGPKIYSLLGQMAKEGLLVRAKHEVSRCTLYGLGRPLMTVEYGQQTEEEKAEKLRARNRVRSEARRRRNGSRPLAEYRAAIKAKPKPAVPVKAAPPAKVVAARNEWMKAGKGAIRNHMAQVAVQPEPARLMSSDEWLAMDAANRVERIPAHWEKSA